MVRAWIPGAEIALPLLQGLLEVSDDVASVFDSDAKPHQRIRDA